MNAKSVRSDFPFFSANDPAVIYFDNAATSQKPAAVIEALGNFYTYHNAPVHRGVHVLGEDATQRYEAVREQVRSFINAADACEIVFTKGATEAINLVAHSWKEGAWEAGSEILISVAEHHANFLPWQHYARKHDMGLRSIPLSKETFLCDDDPEEYITPGTKLIALTLSSNVLGPIWGENKKNLLPFIKKAHRVGARVLLDVAQVAGHEKIDVQELGADFVVFSGHKMLAPTGVGILYVKKEVHPFMEPYQLGGGMVYSAGFDTVRFNDMPTRLEAGTPALSSVIGLGAALDYFKTHIDFEALRRHEALLCARFIQGLETIPGARVLGNKKLLAMHGHLVTFVVEGVHPHDVAMMASDEGLMLRAGHHCAQPLFTFLGIDAALRASFHCYNTIEEIDRGLVIINATVAALKKR